MQTPVQIFALQAMGILECWKDYVALKHLGKPEELTYLPDSNHWPLRPLERLTVQEGASDWFAFWLKGDIDPSPAKAEQFRRWNALKAQAHLH